MKNPNRETVKHLDELPNIGKVISKNLHLIGVDHPQKLIGRNPFELYEELCIKTEKSHDPCVIDVFMSAVDFMEGGSPLPWWSFTEKRKKNISNKK